MQVLKPTIPVKPEETWLEILERFVQAVETISGNLDTIALYFERKGKEEKLLKEDDFE